MSHLFICFGDKQNFQEYSGSWKNRWGKLVLIVSEPTKSSASMRIRYLLQSSGRKRSSALLILTFLVIAENPWLGFGMRLLSFRLKLNLCKFLEELFRWSVHIHAA